MVTVAVGLVADRLLEERHRDRVMGSAVAELRSAGCGAGVAEVRRGGLGQAAVESDNAQVQPVLGAHGCRIGRSEARSLSAQCQHAQ